ncbi:restriction endonuclease subunit S [Clostridium sp. Marseille-Q2269]|uniref:restriction endonuclease subunit S n=1 Tax=Clostridium sp. Marseille-Q2269 TaxID=2942205 RepID=UPI002072F24D|nr:restriction endonuclease subunit S [Clostridium sp. Marseille-Q2269]
MECKSGKLVKIDSGYAFKSNLFNDKNEGMPIIRIRDVNVGKSNTYYSGEYDKKYVVKDCEMLISMDGNFVIKKCNGGKALLNQRVCKIKSVSNVLLDDYIYRILPFELKKIEDATSFVTVKHLSVKTIQEIKINVPKVEVQQKIVNILDQAQYLIDKRKAQIEALDELAKSRVIEMFGDPILNPKGWEKKKLSDECNIITGNTPSRKVEEYYGDYIEWIKSDNIKDSGIYLTKAREYLSEKGLEVGRSVEENSILMTCIAGSVKCIGDVAIANRKVAFNQQINGIEPLTNNVSFMFEQFNLSQKYIQSTINMSLKGILSKGQLSELEFIFPPIELQNEFAESFNQIDKLKFEMKESLEELENSFNSLMQRAFKCELFE